MELNEKDKPADWSKYCLALLVVLLIVSVAGWYVPYQTDQRLVESVQTLDAKISDMQNQLGGIQKQLNELLMQAGSS